MQKLLAKMFEGDSSSGAGSAGVNVCLGDLLKQKGEPQLVHAGDTVSTARRAIARGRKAVSRLSTHNKSLLVSPMMIVVHVIYIGYVYLH